MNSKLKKTISVTVRTLICVGALYLVLHNVSLRDVATLADEDNTPVAIVEITNWDTVQGDERLDDPHTLLDVVVEIDQPPGRVALGDLHKKKDGTPDFQIGLLTVLSNSNVKLLIWAVLIFAPVALIQSFRFTLMVRAQEIDLPAAICLRPSPSAAPAHAAARQLATLCMPCSAMSSRSHSRAGFAPGRASVSRSSSSHAPSSTGRRSENRQT